MIAQFSPGDNTLLIFALLRYPSRFFFTTENVPHSSLKSGDVPGFVLFDWTKTVLHATRKSGAATRIGNAA